MAEKEAKAGFRGYPIATIAFYGPDDRRASKAVVGIIAAEHSDPVDLRRWFDERQDVRGEATTCAEIVAFLRENNARTVAMVDLIIGCPHEEGTDYPEGTDCPHCPFWAGRDRWAG